MADDDKNGVLSLRTFPKNLRWKRKQKALETRTSLEQYVIHVPALRVFALAWISCRAKEILMQGQALPYKVIAKCPAAFFVRSRLMRREPTSLKDRAGLHISTKAYKF